ncbi:sll0787 family AIR synthase-like protein [Epibacterium sp. SM1979]|uniref:Sll0787 family AIR synthase-like protein n=2 Tax=Tritonibacter litoralis TaxID=2662264 RepID=A0A843YKD5_9RHOB|nr:sll0787 family AIR synthase-like protein [Tritonibacter litoralis]
MLRDLRDHPSIRGKLDIADATAGLGLTGDCPGQPGDDAAVLPNGAGFDLFAGEGFINAFVEADPWFAGWCGVMVNISDILAMGGRPRAVTNALWAPSAEAAQPVLAGMKAAASAYGVPIVGGHSNLRTDQLQLAVSIIGHAKALVSSFAARPGDVVIVAVDHTGSYREPFDNWNAALTSTPEKLRKNLNLMPELAEAGSVRAGKDISQGGIIGTALMLAETSGVAIDLQCEAIPLPDGVGLERWLRSFPSFGFLLSVDPAQAEEVCAKFQASGITAAVCGDVSAGSSVSLSQRGKRALFWDHVKTPFIDLKMREAQHA